MVHAPLASTAFRAAELRLFAADAPGLTTVPGEDLVVEPPHAYVTGHADGTLLDDLLSPDDRLALDDEAEARHAAWMTRRRDELVVDGTDLAWVWSDELLAEVFVAEVMAVSGLRRVLERDPPARVALHGFDTEVASCLASVLELETRAVDAAAAPPSYPRPRAAPWHVPWPRRLYRAAIATLGVPPFPKGDVLTLGYWSLTGLQRRMLSEPGLVPLLDPLTPPALPPRELARALLRGGWIGRPNGIQLRRSARELARALTRARARPTGGDELDRLLDVRALRLIEQRATATAALVASTQRALRRGRVRGIVLPWDSPPNARTLIAAARRASVPVVVVQHGFVNEVRTPDKTEADAAAVWSERVVADIAARARGRVVATGNPAATALTRTASRSERASTMILPEYSSRLSARIPERASQLSVVIALEALQRVQPGTVAVVRPHPADHDPGAYLRLGARFDRLAVEVDTTSRIDDVIARSHLCIGTVSTATLQAAAAGVPVVFLDVATAAAPWPFDHSGAMPRVTDADELAREIPRALAGQGQPSPETVADALGLVPDAEDRVLALLRETFLSQR